MSNSGVRFCVKDERLVKSAVCSEFQIGMTLLVNVYFCKSVLGIDWRSLNLCPLVKAIVLGEKLMVVFNSPK